MPLAVHSIRAELIWSGYTWVICVSFSIPSVHKVMTITNCTSQWCNLIKNFFPSAQKAAVCCSEVSCTVYSENETQLIWQKKNKIQAWTWRPIIQQRSFQVTRSSPTHSMIQTWSPFTFTFYSPRQSSLLPLRLWQLRATFWPWWRFGGKRR